MSKLTAAIVAMLIWAGFLFVTTMAEALAVFITASL